MAKERPDTHNDIKLVHIKIGSFYRKEAKEPRKSSSVVKGLNILVSHIRAVKYVLAIVNVCFLTSGPLFAYIVHRGYTPSPPLSIPQHNLGDSELLIKNIKRCLDLIMNHKSECDYVYKDLIQYQNLVELTFDSEKSRMIFRIIALYLGMLNSTANPIL